MELPFPREPVDLALPDGDVRLLPEPDLGCEPARLLEELIAGTPWRQETIRLFGKTHLQPRLIAWYGDEGASYTYSGTGFDPLPWTPRLRDLRARIEAECGASFNSVLVNYYRDQRDSMGMHSDDEPELGKAPVIASLSLGETRTLVFRHRHRKELDSVKVPLPSGSLLLMRGKTQHYWKHGINKQSRPCGPRVNLTFRRIV